MDIFTTVKVLFMALPAAGHPGMIWKSSLYHQLSTTDDQDTEPQLWKNSNNYNQKF